MAFWRRRRQPSQAPGSLDRAADKAHQEHLDQFVRSRRGVEAYVEPRTAMTGTTVVLVAHDGEWTRRRVPGPDAARDMGKRLSMPVYEAAVVGYPQRMRDYNSRRSG